MTLFPFFTDIENKTFLIIGAGKVAQGKIKRLLPFTSRIIVVDDKADIDGVITIQRKFRDEDLKYGDFVICATDDKKLNAHISELCKEKGIPVNSVDDPENCSFIFPSLIKRGDLVVGISSSGKVPAYSKHLRQEIEKIIPDNIEYILDYMNEYRQVVKEFIDDQEHRSELIKTKLVNMLEGSDE